MGRQQSTILLMKAICCACGNYAWKARYAVITAESGEEGLAAFAAAKPDAVLTDLRMPGIDGMALFEAVRQQNKSIRSSSLPPMVRSPIHDGEPRLPSGG